MSISDADIAFARELFAALGDVTSRKMFGGICLYLGGDIFALVSKDGKIHLKAQGDMADELKADGTGRFHNMPYWGIPDAALDDPEVACDLARRTMASL